MSIRVTLNCKTKPQKHDELITFLKHNLPNVRSFNGNQKVDVLFNEEKSVMLLDEDWESVQHHQRYMQFISNNGVMNELIAFFDGPPDVKYFAAESI